jgi:uncharacterized repeat protein (TIGR02543 family)
MKLATRRTSTAIAALATVGATSMFAGVAPAAAAPSEACGLDGTVIAPGICELTLTSGSPTFIRTAQMTKLEVLLVGAGGASSDQPVPNTNGYAAGGGGGAVTIVDFSAGTTDLDVTVADAGVVASASTVDDGTTLTTAGNGTDGLGNVGGTSGNGNVGFAGTTPPFIPYAAGGGAGASPTSNPNGGAGVVVSAIAPGGSLFSGDANCYGGGGAASTAGVTGTATCGGGAGAPGGASIIAPVANSGGGAGGVDTTQTALARTGADGVVVIRWTAATVTLGFSANGHGAAPASQPIVAGNTATAPAAPSAAGFQFQGWYTDASLTTLANFSAPVTASTTYFARWSPLLAATGFDLNPVQIPLAAGSILLGAVFVLMAYRRRPRSN